MGCKMRYQFPLLGFWLLTLCFDDISGFWRSGFPPKTHKAVVIQKKSAAQQRAGSPETVSAQCTEWNVVVTINPDLLGIQHPVQASDLTIGGCGVTSQTPTAFVIEAPLQGCGSTITMLADEIVYTFSLDYIPSPIPGIPIIRTNPAVVQIECHYPRCFTDSKVTGSNSQFLTPRVAPSTLQFELDAFRFYGVATSSVFITCRLKVILASQAIDSLNKACTYRTGLSQLQEHESRNDLSELKVMIATMATAINEFKKDIQKNIKKESKKRLLEMQELRQDNKDLEKTYIESL
ncbi:ZP3 protein, partial [Polypterus senegalus]